MPRGHDRDEPINVGAWASGLSDAFLLCRDLGHTWRPYRAWYDAAERGYQRVLRCGRCKTERVQLLDSSGHPVSGHYNYAEGYQAPRGTGRIDGHERDSLRLESLLRLVGHDEVDPSQPKSRKATA